MALFHYFNKAEKEKDNLPDPDGPLSKTVPRSSIAAANSKVRVVLQSSQSTAGSKKRGSYAKYTPEQKAVFGKRAAEHGVTAAVRHCITI